jgi:transcriptional regulator with XRE-family HTH domain
VDREGLADFLRRRREQLTPAHHGSAHGLSRRTRGLRREEVAELAYISTDYYTRLEQRRGARPSPEVALSLARALALTDDERDHLFVLLDHHPPRRIVINEEADPTLRKVMDSLDGIPALVGTSLGVTLAQNHLAETLLGDHRQFTGWERSTYYRWFVSPEERRLYPTDTHAETSRSFVASIRAATDVHPEAGDLVSAVRARSPEFAALWAEHDVRACRHEEMSLLHPAVGRIDLNVEVLFADNREQKLFIMTARGGSAHDAKLTALRAL